MYAIALALGVFDVVEGVAVFTRVPAVIVAVAAVVELVAAVAGVKAVVVVFVKLHGSNDGCWRWQSQQ